MNSQTLTKRHGFTLVEMMVVITIIGILTGLLLVGVFAAQRAAKRTRILTELQQIDGSFKKLKNDLGAFPPNLAHFDSPPAYIVSPPHDNIGTDLVRFLKKAYPRHQEPNALFEQLVEVQWPSGHPAAGYDDSEGVNAAEAVVLWLGGFSDDPKYPISGKGGPSYLTATTASPAPPGVGIESLEDRNFLYGFDITRLGPRDPTSGGFHDMASDGPGRFIQYQVLKPGNVTETRRIHFWTYTPTGSSMPFTYYDTSRYGPNEYDVAYYLPTDENVVVFPLKTRAGSGTGVVFANQKSFQILHAGIDDEWGDFSALSWYQIDQGSGIGYPDGPFREELSDTLTNFSEGELEDSEP